MNMDSLSVEINPNKGPVIILGSGRLANRLVHLFKASNLETTNIDSANFREIGETSVQESSMDYAREFLIKEGVAKASSVCIVDSEDAVNIFLLMAVLAVREDASILATFFNESLVSDLALKHRNIRVFNPADIVSRLFVESVPKSMPKDEEVKVLTTYRDAPTENLVWWLVAGFVWLIFSGTLFFYLTEPVDWLRSLYLVVTVITSVNFNDAELKNYGRVVQVMRMSLMLATCVYVIAILSVIMDYVMRRRMDMLTLGRKKYNKRGHVIVCGLGRVGYATVQHLIAKGEDILVIESNQDNRYLPALRAYGTSVLIGDATLEHYLVDAGIGKAKALICAIDSDMINLEIGLNARSENPKIRLLLRIFDQMTAQEMKKRFNIHHVFSKSFVTAQTIFSQISQGRALMAR